MYSNREKFYVRNTEDILKSVDSFCNYYHTIKKYINRNKIISSLDRGTFSHPKDILTNELLDLLGNKRDKNSYAYGIESGEELVRQKIYEVENLKYDTNYSLNDVAIVAGAWSGVELVIEELASLEKGMANKITVLTIGPTHYQLFHRSINKIGIKIVGFDFVNCQKDSVPKTFLDIKKGIEEVKPEVVFITNPNNPNGIYYDSKVVRALVEFCKIKEKEEY